MVTKPAKIIFRLGHVAVTHGINTFTKGNPARENAIVRSVARHMGGDWGEVDVEDKESNDRALETGGRLVSAYHFPEPDDRKFWVITEADRSATTILFPEEY